MGVGQKQGVGSMLLELDKRKNADHFDFVRKDDILKTRVSAEERSCREGV